MYCDDQYSFLSFVVRQGINMKHMKHMKRGSDGDDDDDDDDVDNDEEE